MRRISIEMHYLGGIFVAAGEKKCSEWGNLGLVVIRTSFLITMSPRLPLTEHMAGHGGSHSLMEVADTSALSHGTHLTAVTLVLR